MASVSGLGVMAQQQLVGVVGLFVGWGGWRGGRGHIECLEIDEVVLLRASGGGARLLWDQGIGFRFHTGFRFQVARFPHLADRFRTDYVMSPSVT